MLQLYVFNNLGMKFNNHHLHFLESELYPRLNIYILLYFNIGTIHKYKEKVIDLGS